MPEAWRRGVLGVGVGAHCLCVTKKNYEHWEYNHNLRTGASLTGVGLSRNGKYSWVTR